MRVSMTRSPCRGHLRSPRLRCSFSPLRQAPVRRTAQPGSLAGVYDGGQMEIAAALELKPDGRFNYALSYGALKALHDLAELTTSILETFEAHCKGSDDKIAKLASVKSGRAGDGKVLLIGSTKPASVR